MLGGARRVVGAIGVEAADEEEDGGGRGGGCGRWDAHVDGDCRAEVWWGGVRVGDEDFAVGWVEISGNGVGLLIVNCCSDKKGDSLAAFQVCCFSSLPGELLLWTGRYGEPGYAIDCRCSSISFYK